MVTNQIRDYLAAVGYVTSSSPNLTADEDAAFRGEIATLLGVAAWNVQQEMDMALMSGDASNLIGRLRAVRGMADEDESSEAIVPVQPVIDLVAASTTVEDDAAHQAATSTANEEGKDQAVSLDDVSDRDAEGDDE